MLRAVLSVIAGYAAVFLCVFIPFTAIYFAIGADRAFKPGTYELSALWIAIALFVNLFAAMVGGAVCALIARTRKPPLIFAAIVFVLGVVAAFANANKADPGLRDASVDNIQAMTDAKEPMWFLLTTPVIGAAGIVAGATLVQRRRDARQP